MANKDDYLNDYRQFFEHFAQTVNPNDQLPVKLGSYKLINVEVVGGIIDWTTQYLTQKNCPECLVPHLIKIVIEEMRKACKKQPISCGFVVNDNAYEPLKLMQSVMAKTNEICSRYLDNSMLCSLPSPGPPYFKVSVYAMRNSRRKMEDRHVVVNDLNTIFHIQEASPSSFYAVYDGHAGHDAAAYSAAHLHQYLAESKHFVSNPEQALKDAFCKTDALFLDKCAVENFNSGTTAVCALLRPKEKTLYVAWAGDSLALLVNQGRILQCVNPHKPEREDERARIENNGGIIMMWGTWRVNGHLAVSRAIGDADYKPFVTATPDVREIPLNGGEDFLIIACDGLWDFLSEDDAARTVYELLRENPDDIESISHHLVQLSKNNGSKDNISVIIVFLREPSKIAAEAHWANRYGSTTMDASIDNANNTNNPFTNSNCSDILSTQNDGYLLNFKHNGKENLDDDELCNERKSATNGKRIADEFDDDDDLGPETDVDAVDDVLMSPSIQAAKAISEGVICDNTTAITPTKTSPTHFEFENKEQRDDDDDDDDDEEEKLDTEVDINLEKKEVSDFDEEQPTKVSREETPTPPADEVQDVSGLIDNVAESGDDSEDEWNYYKAENKENINPDQEVANLTQSVPQEDSDDTMSQLNPNAAEFVPISPTRAMSPPVCSALKNDSILAQSPKQPPKGEVDINVPQLEEFVTEVQSRPSEIFRNGHESRDNAQKLSSQEIMEKFLNSNYIDDIDFQPSTPNKVQHNPDEFHFGPNAAPFTPNKILDQSEALSTNAVCGDDTTNNIEESFNEATSPTINEPIMSGIQHLNKEQDPMSMSFYQEKDDENLFDLNKVHELPSDLDAYLAQTNDNESVSKNRDVLLETTDLDKSLEHHDVNEPMIVKHETDVDIHKVDVKHDDEIDVEYKDKVNTELGDNIVLKDNDNIDLEHENKIDIELHDNIDLKHDDKIDLEHEDKLDIDHVDKVVIEHDNKVDVEYEDIVGVEQDDKLFNVDAEQGDVIAIIEDVKIEQVPVSNVDHQEIINENIVDSEIKDDNVELLRINEEAWQLNKSPKSASIEDVSCEEVPKSPAMSPEPELLLHVKSEENDVLSKTPEPTSNELNLCQNPPKDDVEVFNVEKFETEAVIETNDREFCGMNLVNVDNEIKELPPLLVENVKETNLMFEKISPLPEQAIENDYCKSPASSQRTEESANSPFRTDLEQNVEETCKYSPTPELESPHEDITSSVKDDSVSPTPSPVLDFKPDNVRDITPVLSPVQAVQESEIVCEFALNIETTNKSPSPILSPVEELNVVQNVPLTENVPICEKVQVCENLQASESILETELITPPEPAFEATMNYSEEISKAIEETAVTPTEIKTDIIPDTSLVLSPESVTSEQSITTTDVNSFLDRSNIPDVTSPIMSPEAPNQLIEEAVTQITEAECILQKEIADIPLPAPVDIEPVVPIVPAEVLVKPIEPIQQQVKKTTEAEKKSSKPKTSATIPKKPTTKAPTPSKAPTPKTLTRATPTKTSTPVGRTITKTPTKTTTTASRTATSPTKPTAASPLKAAVPKTSLMKTSKPATITKLAERKPLQNGDIKAKTTTTTTTRSITKPMEKVPLKSTTPSKPTTRTSLTSPRPKPTTASTTTRTSLVNKTLSSTTSATRSTSATVTKSTTLTSKTTSARPSTGTTTTTTTTSSAARPKSAPMTTTRARLPSAKSATSTKAPDTQKQIKENANKLTASRTAAPRNTLTKNGTTTVTNVKKTESRMPITRPTTTKTTTAATSKTKKPSEIIRNNDATKTKITTTKVASTTAIKPPPGITTNGLNETTTTTTVIETVTTISSNGIEEESHLMKDNSPVENLIMDNSQLPETQVAD